MHFLYNKLMFCWVCTYAVMHIYDAISVQPSCLNKGRVERWKEPTYNFIYCCIKILKPLKGILHQKIFYRLNLIFWIVMGCGIARFGRRGLKTTETWSQNLSPGVLRRGAPGVSRHSNMGFRGAATLIKHFSDLSFRAVPRGPIWLPGTSRDGTMRMVLIAP